MAAKKGRGSQSRGKLKKSAADLGRSTGAKLTPVDTSSIVSPRMARQIGNIVRRTVRTEISTISNSDWLGAQQPVRPIVPEAASEFRTWDYPPGYNVNFQPKKYTPYTFQQLQWLADNFDLLRQVIERRKAHYTSLKWDIVAREGEDTDEDATKAIKEFLRYPDRIHPYATWMGMLLEDMLVIDAATIYPHPTLGGGVWSFDVVSGASITPLIDETGRLPVPPDPAFQQIIRGIPYNNFTADELVYAPRTLRPYSPIFGFSQVEHLVMSIAIGLKAEMRELFYFTQGTIPDALLSTPEFWTAKQIAQFQAWFDSLMRGNLARRSGGAIFVPGGTKDVALKDYKFNLEMWEWLARMVCAEFQVSPQPYIREVNRATADTARMMQLAEDLEPVKLWWKSLINLLLDKYFRRPDLEHHWKEEDDTDPINVAKAAQTRVFTGLTTPNEERVAVGEDPYPDGVGDKPFIMSGGTAIPLDQIGAAPGPPVPSENGARQNGNSPNGKQPNQKPEAISADETKATDADGLKKKSLDAITTARAAGMTPKPPRPQPDALRAL